MLIFFPRQQLGLPSDAYLVAHNYFHYSLFVVKVIPRDTRGHMPLGLGFPLIVKPHSLAIVFLWLENNICSVFLL